MVELQVIKPIWRTKKTDLIPAIATFLSCLFLRLEIGIVIGIGINVVFLLYATARPSVHVEKVTGSYGCDGCDYLLITPDRSLTFPSVEYVRALVSKAGVKQGSSSIPVVIDARHIQGADFTAAKGIKSLIEDFHKRNQPILFYNLKPSVINIFQGVQPKDFVYCETYNELNELLKKHALNSQVANQNGGKCLLDSVAVKKCINLNLLCVYYQIETVLTLNIIQGQGLKQVRSPVGCNLHSVNLNFKPSGNSRTLKLPKQLCIEHLEKIRQSKLLFQSHIN
ncbi:hypothetical protein NQ317_015767 [Molorchus minor]|uniref:STAS domain-containing protein n=1 Tax=Molorchus minor TaxID=1323400 RepID=A0ABQ9K222_9CUCU|nr:hypothetical protein NQ317_015767 [Molorchus minor]